MKSDKIAKLFAEFESVVRVEQAVEYWFARELQALLGYDRWENFAAVLERARAACSNAGQAEDDHFRGVTKMVPLGSGAQRAVEDVALTRYACYLLAQNGDPRKEPIAFAQSYFAVQTRRQELVEARIADAERLRARRRLTASERDLSQLIFERLDDRDSFARIRSRGDQALFGGLTTSAMKARLGVPGARPLADFLPTITIKAKDFATEITLHNTRENELASERAISGEHVKSNTEVRRALGRRGIRPETLPPAEDVKRVERRLDAEARRLPRRRGDRAGPRGR